MCGALSLYVLTGSFFSSLFSPAAEIDSDAFFSHGDDGTVADHLYFSFITSI